MTSPIAALLDLSCFLLPCESRQRGISEAASNTRCCLGTIHRLLHGTSAVRGALSVCLAAAHLGTLLRCHRRLCAGVSEATAEAPFSELIRAASKLEPT